MSEKVNILNEVEFDNFVKEGIVLIDFFAEWCGPCMMMVPVLGEVNEHFKGEIKIAKVDVSRDENLARKYDVSSIPNFLVFKNGKVVEQFVGVKSFEDLVSILEKYL